MLWPHNKLLDMGMNISSITQGTFKLTYVQVPLFVKREGRRSSEPVPMVLPSTLFRDFVETPEVLKKSADNYDNLLKGLPCYEQQPLVQQSRAAGTEQSLRPVALVWDGVQYSVHDAFTGFYVTDILSQQKFVSFLLSQVLSVLGTGEGYESNSALKECLKEARTSANAVAGDGAACFPYLIGGLSTLSIWGRKRASSFSFWTCKLAHYATSAAALRRRRRSDHTRQHALSSLHLQCVLPGYAEVYKSSWAN